MKRVTALLTFSTLAMTGAYAQMAQPMVSETTTRISDRVWAIMGFPNIAIVVGNSATLVVDTGMGPKNGATAIGEREPINRKHRQQKSHRIAAVIRRHYRHFPDFLTAYIQSNRFTERSGRAGTDGVRIMIAPAGCGAVTGEGARGAQDQHRQRVQSCRGARAARDSQT